MNPTHRSRSQEKMKKKKNYSIIFLIFSLFCIILLQKIMILTASDAVTTTNSCLLIYIYYRLLDYFFDFRSFVVVICIITNIIWAWMENIYINICFFKEIIIIIFVVECKILTGPDRTALKHRRRRRRVDWVVLPLIIIISCSNNAVES